MFVSVEQCTARPCGALVSIAIDNNGGLPVAVNGYNGLTDDGDPVCSDHFCPTCGGAHIDVAQFERCAFTGVRTLDLTPICSRETALLVLDRYHRTPA